MNNWVTIRKTPVSIYLECGVIPGNTLDATNIGIAVSSEFAISLDLDGNLNKRNKQCGLYQDARALANGRIKNLQMVQIDHKPLITHILKAWKSTGSRAEWKLVIQLEGMRSFRVKPESRPGSSALFLSLLN